MAATTAACLLLVGAPLLAAQRTPATAASSELAITGGVGQSMRRDLSASPLDFSGRGGGGAIALRHEIGPSAIEFTLNGGLHSLRSSSRASRATERVGQGQISVALLRTLGAESECACGIAIGAALSANMMLTRHVYDDPTHRSSDFLYSSAGVGPAAAWRAAVAGGYFDARVIVPVASVVEHSYSIVNEHDAATKRRFAAPNALRSATTTFAFTLAAKRRVGLTWLYRADVLRYDDVQPVRALTQSLSMGVVARFGTKGRIP